MPAVTFSTIERFYLSGTGTHRQPRTTWVKNIHDDLSSMDLGIHEARDTHTHTHTRLMALCPGLPG